MSNNDFYVRYYVGHKGKFGHEFLEFEFRPDGESTYEISEIRIMLVPTSYIVIGSSSICTLWTLLGPNALSPLRYIFYEARVNQRRTQK